MFALVYRLQEILLRKVTYIVVGMFGASAYLNTLSAKTDLLAALNNANVATTSVCFFPLMAALSGVPIFSIVIRYNLIELKVDSRVATFLSTVFRYFK